MMSDKLKATGSGVKNEMSLTQTAEILWSFYALRPSLSRFVGMSKGPKTCN
ncbi:unnamed protein product [Tenebrio molitor]|nr:unnamed protein product [Tenebrio molitor]